MALLVEQRQAVGDALAGHLRQVLHDRIDCAQNMVLFAYWPIKGEPDLRALMADPNGDGATVAVPLVDTKTAPLTFRLWTPETKRVRGDRDIPVPVPGAPEVMPEIALAPVVGWTADGDRLGLGGGYVDRTLAALDPRPFAIGIGFDAARPNTFYPQPHDIPLDLILTEAGAPRNPARD